MDAPVIQVQNLTKIIRRKYIVKNLNFDINDGEIVGFLGPNGSGKTTTMKMMLGLTTITEGDVVVCGESMKNKKEEALKFIGGIIEYPQFYDFLTGYENLAYLQQLTETLNKKKIIEVASLVGITEYIDNKVKTYSLGMKQRLGIAQSLLSSPKLLILDEPTNGLDSKGILELRTYLKEMSINNRMAIFISSHLLSEMELLCDRLIIIQDGVIRQDIKHKNTYDSMVVSLKVDNKINTLDILQRNMIRTIDSDNEQLNLRIPYERIPELIEELIKNNIKIFSVTPRKETLEERYLARTSGGS